MLSCWQFGVGKSIFSPYEIVPKTFNSTQAANGFIFLLTIVLISDKEKATGNAYDEKQNDQTATNNS